MRIDSEHPDFCTTKVYDRNGDEVPRCIWLDDSTHEVCTVDVDEKGKVRTREIPTPEGEYGIHMEVVYRTWKVEGWTYRTGDGVPQLI
jgi:hypothetical protein